MSYIHKPNLQPLEHRIPFQLLHVHTQAYPNKEAFVFRDAKSNRLAVTFKEYESKSQSLAAALLELGLVRGDRVLLMLQTNVDFLYIHMALNMIGAISVIVEQDAYPAIQEVKQLACIIADINYTEHASESTENTVHELRRIFEQDKLKAGIIVGSTVANHDLLAHPRVYTYEKLYGMADRMNSKCYPMVLKAQAQVQFDDPTFVLFTSGTTGSPKPIQFTNQAFVNGAWANTYSMAIDKESILFCDGPFDWVSGMGFSIAMVILHGCTTVCFSPRLAFKGGFTTTITKVLEEESCSHAVLRLYFLQDLASSKEVSSVDLSKIKYFLTGSQPTSISLINKIFSLLPRLTMRNMYGATETNMIAFQEINANTLESLNFGVMEIIPGYEVKVVDDEGKVVPYNTPGELCVRANWVSFMNRDLLKNLDEAKCPRDVVSGWHHTKDLASINSDGQLRLVGRIDNMIKCASKLIQPVAIEEELLENPDIEKVCVVGVPDKRLYQKICACVIMKTVHRESSEVLRPKLEEWCKGKFHESTVGLILKPHYFVFFDDFPLTRTGKLNRRMLKEMAKKELAM